MTTSLDLLDMVHDAIVGAGTDADRKVFKPGDWPVQPGQYPIIKLRLVRENRSSLGRSGPAEFTTIAVVQIVGEVSAPAKLDDDGATDAEAKLWTLKRQIDCAVVNSYPLAASIQQIASMNSQLAFNSEAATHLAGIQTDVALEFYEGPENFAPPPVGDLDEVDLSVPGFGVGVIVDRLNEQE